MSKLTDLIEAETRASEASRDEPSRGAKRSAAAGAVYSLRLPADKITKLQDLAAVCGVPPTVLLRQWVLARLDGDGDESLRAMIHDEVREAVREAIARR